jgi:predicted amidohydrolase
MSNPHDYSDEEFTVAAVQASPVYLDRDATVEKACRLIREAADNKAKIIAFPETFIPGYPYWNWINAPIDGYDWYKKYRKQAVDVPSPVTKQLCRVANHTDTFVVMGITERDPATTGTLYNTNLIISDQGELLGKHRKIVPTHAEKLTWGRGDGSSITVYDTPYGQLGTLACGENTNPLARYALMAQGEQIHISNYPAFHFNQEYDIGLATKIRSHAHAFEGKVFNIVSTEYFDESFYEVCESDRARELLGGENQSYFTAIVGPTGEILAGPLDDKEGIVYADISIEETIEPKLMHDVVGQYNRFDIFEFNINRNKLKPLHEQSEQEQTQPNQTSQLKNLPESESARQPPEASDSTPNK